MHALLHDSWLLLLFLLFSRHYCHMLAMSLMELLLLWLIPDPTQYIIAVAYVVAVYSIHKIYTYPNFIIVWRERKFSYSQRKKNTDISSSKAIDEHLVLVLPRCTYINIFNDIPLSSYVFQQMLETHSHFGYRIIHSPFILYVSLFLFF